MKVALTLETLKDLDYGKIDVAFKQHLARAVEDCMDRPGDSKPRQVLLTFELVPDTGQGHDCEAIDLQAHVQSKVPAHRSRKFACAPRKGGHITFDLDSPDDVNQRSFGEPEGEQHDVAGSD